MTTAPARRAGHGLTDEAIAGIRSMIVDGDIKPGEKLPREADLAKVLGISRNSLREAVRALSLVNVLDVRQGDGTYVSSLTPGRLLEGLNFIIDFHQTDSILEFVRVRRILEPEAAAMAARLVSDEQLAQMQAAVDSSSLAATPEHMLVCDIDFHRLIGAASGNTVLAGLLEGLSAPTNRARVLRGRTQPGAAARTVAEHQAIVDAIRSREPDVARSAMLMHVAGVEIWLREHQALGRLDLLDGPAAPG